MVSLLHGKSFHDPLLPVSAMAMSLESVASLEEHVPVDCNSVRLFFALLLSRQTEQIGRETMSEAGPLPMAWIKAGQPLSSCTKVPSFHQYTFFSSSQDSLRASQ